MLRVWKKKSSIHNAFSSEKVVSTKSGEKYAHIKHCLQEKTAQNSFSLDKALLWIMTRNYGLKLKCLYGFAF